MTFNLFISHSWSYSDAYEKLISMLDSETHFPYKNYSVPKNDPIHNASSDAALRAAIKNQMQYASVVVILAGVYSTYSKWINIEIGLALEEFSTPKPILAIEPWGSQKTSSTVKDAADKIVGWRASSIVEGIRELA